MCACVEPVLLPKGAIEAAVCKNDNIASFEGEYVGVQHFFGQGAGKFPTAYAVVEDLRDLLSNPGKSHLRAGEPALKLDGRRVTKRYYLRTAAPVEIEAARRWGRPARASAASCHERGGYARAGCAAARHRRDDLLRRSALNAGRRRAYTEWDVMFA